MPGIHPGSCCVQGNLAQEQERQGPPASQTPPENSGRRHQRQAEAGPLSLCNQKCLQAHSSGAGRLAQGQHRPSKSRLPSNPWHPRRRSEPRASLGVAHLRLKQSLLPKVSAQQMQLRPRRAGEGPRGIRVWAAERHHGSRGGRDTEHSSFHHSQARHCPHLRARGNVTAQHRPLLRWVCGTVTAAAKRRRGV